MDIFYIERKTGEKCQERVYGGKALEILYGTGFFQKLISALLLPLVARFSLASTWYGYLQRGKGSAKKIGPFIETYGVDASEFESSHFRSFNDFFIRKLLPGKRPIVSGAGRLAMPADGRYLVYPKIGKFLVKAKEFSLGTFLLDSPSARRFSEGSMAIIRLAPSDYHRFHFPCDGVPSEPRLINGFLYSVNPIALARRPSILSENKRMVTEIETEAFGTIFYVEVGATHVGSIHQTFTPYRRVEKGEEKGYFEFGGSCIVLLFEKGRIQFDSDLIENTEKGFETYAHFGDSLGISK